MQSLRIYVPTARVNDPAVRRGLDRVLAGGATLYAATGATEDENTPSARGELAGPMAKSVFS